MLVISQVILIHNKQILIQELRAVPEEKKFKKIIGDSHDIPGPHLMELLAIGPVFFFLTFLHISVLSSYILYHNFSRNMFILWFFPNILFV